MAPPHDTLRSSNKAILVHPPIFWYLGHTITHLYWSQKAKDEVLAKAEANLTRCNALL